MVDPRRGTWYDLRAAHRRKEGAITAPLTPTTKELVLWPRLVCIVGIDGSGKTTLARSVVEVARSAGVEYQYVWGNAQPILMRPLRWVARATVLRGKDMFRDYSGYKAAKRSIVKGSHLTTRLYTLLLLLDYALWLLARVSLPLLVGKRVVCDRYVYDVAINTSLLLGLEESASHRWIGVLLRVFPKPDCLFLVDVPEQVAFTRKTDVPSMAYLEERRHVYAKIMPAYSATPLDGTLPVDALVDRIWRGMKGTRQ